MANFRKKKWFRWVVIGVVAVFVLGGGTTAFLLISNAKSADSTTTFTVRTAESGSIKVSITGSGTVSNGDEHALTAASAGEVDSVSVKSGDTVKKGQVIAHVNDTSAADTVMQKQSSLQSAENNLTSAEEQLDSLTVKAPIAGRVKSLIAEAGDDVSTLRQLGNLAVISTEREMQLALSSVSQSLTVGQAVKVYVGSTAYNGTVTSLSGTVKSTEESSGSTGSTGTSSGGSGRSGSYSGGTAGTAAAGGSTGGTASTSYSGVVVTVNSDDPAVGSTATVKTTGGTALGTGTLELVSYIPISASSGTIKSVAVAENQLVSKNQALFTLDGSSVQSQIAQCEQAVKLAQDDLANAQSALDEETIKSPIAGTIAELDVKAGDNVSSGGSIATIINPNIMETVISIDELDISKVKVGQAATVSLDAVSGKTFDGEVTEIDQIGTASNGVTDYNVTVAIDNPTGIKVGMTTNVSIVTQSADNVIVVPTSAVVLKEGTTGYILPANSAYANSDGTPKQLKNANVRELARKYGQQVTIGITNSDEYEITDGLDIGDQYVVAVTISKSAIASLSNTTSTSTGFFSMGGMGGGNFGGGNFSGNRSTRRTTGGSTTTTNKSTTGTGGNTTGGNTTGGNKTGGGGGGGNG